MEIHQSARRHNVNDADIVHAVSHAIAWLEVGDDPVRYLLVGPDHAGNLIELVVLDAVDVQLVIHAMPARAATLQHVLGGA